jgi:hypothetical protein
MSIWTAGQDGADLAPFQQNPAGAYAGNCGRGAERPPEVRLTKIVTCRNALTNCGRKGMRVDVFVWSRILPDISLPKLRSQLAVPILTP